MARLDKGSRAAVAVAFGLSCTAAISEPLAASTAKSSLSAVASAAAPAAADSTWSPQRTYALHSDDPVTFLPSGRYAASVQVWHRRLVIALGRVTRDGRLHASRRLPFTPHHPHRNAVRLRLSAAFNRRGDAVVAWSYACGSDELPIVDLPFRTVIAFVPAHGRRIIRQLEAFEPASLQTAINERGAGVALFDTELAVRIGRGIPMEQQTFGEPFQSTFTAGELPRLGLTPSGGFRFTAFRYGEQVDVETREAGADGRFAEPSRDYTFSGSLARGPVAARNESGDMVVAWASGDRAPRRDTGPVRVALRRNGVWTGAVELSPDTWSPPAVAMGADGTAVVAYGRREEPGGDTRLTVAVAEPGQAFGPARVIAGSIGADQPSAIVDGHGRRVVAWMGGFRNWSSFAAVAEPGGAFGPPTRLSECFDPQLVLDTNARAVAALTCDGGTARDHRAERVLSSSN
jgi:hypothetical protein